MEENRFIKFWFERDILNSTFENTIELDLLKMKEVIQIREEISGEKKQYWLYDITNVKNITKEARDYADKQGQDRLSAVGVLVNSHVTKFIFNSYFKLKKSKMPFQVFTNKEKALEWLLSLKEKSKMDNL